MMRTGSLLFLDDTQIHSIAEVSRLLEQQPGFTLRDELGKLQVWEKEDNQPFLPEYSREPYILEMTRAAASSGARSFPTDLGRRRRTSALRRLLWRSRPRRRCSAGMTPGGVTTHRGW